jgi:riboflavin kinase/FMN adenylyltransferase
MQVYKGIRLIQEPVKKSVVTIGNFDGVHLGHREIFKETLRQAKLAGAQAWALTFRPHPQVALRPETNIPLLLTYDEKLEILAECGLDGVVEEPFSREFSTTSPEVFFRDVLLRKLGAAAVVVGYDFAFGKGREGGLTSLEQFCQQAGAQLTVVPPYRVAGEVASSSLIRKKILAGDVRAARALMGRPFFYRGVVVKGEGRGRKIGFATANLKLDNKLVVPYGVYATEARILGEDRIFASVTNVGVRPTFTDQGRELPALIETHLLDQNIDLYGRTLEVRFVERLRAEQKFSGVEALKRQISDDAERARQLLSQSS